MELDWKSKLLSRLNVDLNLPKINFKTVNRVLSQTFNHRICFEYSVRSQLSAVYF